MVSLLLTYWPVLLLLYVPRLAQLVAVVIATRTKSRLDHRIPDDLPLTAGEWLAQQLAALQIDVGAVVSDKHADGYRPLDRLIQLHDTTHFKADPTCWATAAHELGHARCRVDLPAIGHLRTLGTLLSWLLVVVGVGSLAGYALYAIPDASHLAFACFAVAAALQIFVLVDEAAASVYAYRALRANDAIDFTHLRAIRAVLLTAFATYLTTYASYAMLLTQWSLLATLAHPPTQHALTALGWIAVVVLTAASVAAWRVKRGWLPIVLLVLLVWDVIDPAYAWCVIAALAGTWHVWHRVAHWPLALPFLGVALYAKRLEGPGVERTPRFLRLREQGARAIVDGNARIAALQAYWRANPILVTRAWTLLRLGYLPLLVAIWL